MDIALTGTRAVYTFWSVNFGITSFAIGLS